MTDPKPIKEQPKPEDADNDTASSGGNLPTEIGGRKGPDPTRYGDWEIGGKCVDF